jgi:Sec-independent protein secretion pathway component TatC
MHAEQVGHLDSTTSSDACNAECNAACRLVFAYQILTPAALQFFVQYADGAVESLWSIDQYFEFVLVLLLSTGLSFQVIITSGYWCMTQA